MKNLFSVLSPLSGSKELFINGKKGVEGGGVRIQGTFHLKSRFFLLTPSIMPYTIFYQTAGLSLRSSAEIRTADPVKIF